MSKGKRKFRISQLVRAELTTEEGRLLADSFDHDTTHPIAAAIIGAELVEHDLDRLLYKKLKLKDRTVWETLVGENGPLSSFHRKITLGFAVKLFDDRIRHDLTLVKNVRNVFAHNRKLITFKHEKIMDELLTSKLVSKELKNMSKTGTDQGNAQFIYTVLCLRLSLRLLRKNRPTTRGGKKLREAFLQTFLSQNPPTPARAELQPPQTPQSRTGDPNPQARPPRMGDILGYLDPKKAGS